MNHKIATALMVLCAASSVGCSKSAISAADPTQPEEEAVATTEELEDEGEIRAKRVEAVLAGGRAPAPVIQLVDGGSVDLGEIVGQKPVYLKFWATWCVPCREQMPHFESVQQRAGDRMAVVAVNVGLNDTKEAVRDFQREHGLSMPIGYDADGSVATAFQVEVTPQHVLIDSSGSIAYVGHRASDELERSLTAMLAGDGASPDSPQTEDAPAPEPEPEPDAQTLALDLLDGGSFQLADPGERPVVLSFVATWCDWYLEKSRPAMSQACIDQQVQLNELHAALGSRAQFIGVAQSLWTNEDQLHGYRERYGIPFSLALDRGARWFNHFEVRDVPTTIVLDASGAERLRVTGAPADLRAQLESILAP